MQGKSPGLLGSTHTCFLCSFYTASKVNNKTRKQTATRMMTAGARVPKRGLLQEAIFNLSNGLGGINITDALHTRK